MNDNTSINQNTTSDASGKAGDSPPAPLALDPDKYREQLAEFALTREQENELLATLWQIMRTFVEIGFGLDSVQLFSAPMVENTGSESEYPVNIKNGTHGFNPSASHPKRKEDEHE